METEERSRALKEKRERAEFEYDRFKKKFSETSEYNEYKRKRIEQLMESKNINSDPKLNDIYKERLELIKEFQMKESEFSESYEKEWRKLNEEMDMEEKEILKSNESEEEEQQEYEEEGNEDRA